MKKTSTFLMILSFLTAFVNKSFATDNAWNVAPTTYQVTSTISIASQSGSITTSPGTSVSISMNNYYSATTMNYTLNSTTGTNIGNGTLTFTGVNANFTNNTNIQYLAVSLTDYLGHTTASDPLVNVVEIQKNASPAENLTIDFNPVKVNGAYTIDFTKITKINFTIVNAPTGFGVSNGLIGTLNINGLVYGNGTLGISTVTNPVLSEEWQLEANNFMYNTNNGGVLVGDPKTVPAQLLSYPFYGFTCSGRGNFVGDISALNVWSPLNPASGYKHYLSFSNQTFSDNTEYSMINAYEWNGPANNGHAKHLLFQKSGGNIGLGNFTSAPPVKLSIFDGTTSSTDMNVLLKLANNWNSSGINEPTLIFDNGVTSTVYGGYGWAVGAQVAGTGYFRIGRYTGTPSVYTEYLKIADNGAVSIGTKHYNGTTYANYKLSVDGMVLGQKFVTTAPTNWADYVFKSSYKLSSLEEQEEFINKNGHLKDVPSETEVLANGYDVADMDAKLLQKVEELYLYTIELNKTIEQQKKLLEEQQKAISELKNNVK